MDPLAQGLMIIFGTVLGGGLLAFVIIVNMRANLLIVRDPSNTRAYCRIYKCMESKDKYSGALYWKSVFWQKRIKCPEPPQKCIDVTGRGRKYAEVYRLSEDEFVYINDRGIHIKMVKGPDGKTRRVIVDSQMDGKQLIVDTLKPFSVVQRETIVNQYRKAQELRNKKWTADKIVAVSAMGGIVIMVIALMVFWGDLASPILEMDNRLAAREEKLAQLEAQYCAADVRAQTPPTQPQSGIVQQGEEPPR